MLLDLEDTSIAFDVGDVIAFDVGDAVAFDEDDVVAFDEDDAVAFDEDDAVAFDEDDAIVSAFDEGVVVSDVGGVWADEGDDITELVLLELTILLSVSFKMGVVTVVGKLVFGVF